MADKNVTLPVTGMTCANCALNIERSLKKLTGVKSTNVNFATERATLSFDPEQVQLDRNSHNRNDLYQLCHDH
jgi:Cu+-exporting ATPase